ncbi:Inner membrane protein ycdZ [Kluyvera cryocrescens]|uniref:Inner membrane protein ycdZ n=1 Tax=Kluyvera cryocrescens TaxID=580 RepID=A0A485CD89_KLUCR|nr:Inner membrane protein ycdZ [Kluyvera cryocrescens]
MGCRFTRVTQLAGFLGCTAYFACPTGGLKGLVISACTTMSGVIWALVIIYGSALAPHLEIVSYVMTGIVAFLMCIQAKQLLLFICTRHLHRRLVRPLPDRAIGSCCSFFSGGTGCLAMR